MKRINNKGFTLVEVIAVVVIIALLGMIAIPNVISTINKGKDTSYEILVKDINIAAKQLYEEVEYVGVVLKNYNTEGEFGEIIINSNSIETNLQTLVSNGFLSGINNPDMGGSNKNYKIITNPRNGEDIGECKIIIEKIVDKGNNFNTSYKVYNSSTDINCPNYY